MLRCVLAATTALVLALPAAAQVQRNFPANALRGEALFGTPPELSINGRPTRLGPGARIRGENNMLQMSGSLVTVKAVVHYTREPTSGLVLDVWLLTPEESSKRPWPTTEAEARAWRFDPAAQAWTKP